MSPLRPLGNVAGNLQVLSVLILHKLRHSEPNATQCCWVDDDGCVYLAPISNVRARAVAAHAPEQIINRYRKPAGAPLPLTVFDLHNDLLEGAVAFGHRQLALARAHAMTA